MSEFDIFELGNIVTQKGFSLPNAKLAYKTFGTLNSNKDNVIVYPTWYSGFVSDNVWLIGEGMALDPTKYFIIIVCALGNGQSSSPSNTPEPYNGPNFPKITLYDNVTLQHRFVTSHFGIKKIKLVVGWSMGAQQTYQWGSLYPNMVERIAPFCGSAKTAPHNFVFLEGVKAALTADAEFKNGNYDISPKKGTRSAARVYSGWGFSQPFYSQEKWRDLGFNSLEDFLVGFWEGFFLKRDANNLLCMLWTWQNADISNNDVFNGDFVTALKTITMPSVIMPAKIDLYFPPEDNEEECKHIPNAKYACM
jgi:homoserine O-acetyltransferase